MKKTIWWSVSTTAVASSCLGAAIWGASASEASTSPRNSQESVLKCYKTIRDPNRIVCYRVSMRPLHKGGHIVFVPFLVEVPTPSDPPPAITVNDLPGTDPGTNAGTNSRTGQGR